MDRGCSVLEGELTIISVIVLYAVIMVIDPWAVTLFTVFWSTEVSS